jgi:hypothetical protein
MENNNKTVVNKAVEGNLPLIIYINRIAILNKYFLKSFINLSPFILIV